jgi:hypothetical protein
MIRRDEPAKLGGAWHRRCIDVVSMELVIILSILIVAMLVDARPRPEVVRVEEETRRR